jgi:tetratricopeptide (TPR) repeat protein
MGAERGGLDKRRWLEIAERGVAADASDPMAHYNLGEALAANGRPSDAIAEFDQAATHSDYRDRHYLYFRRGILHYNLEHFEEAQGDYARALELRPSTEAHLYLADAFRALEHRADARVHYREALRRDRTLVDALRGYLAVGSPEEERQYRVFEYVVGRIDRMRLPLSRWLRPIAWRMLLFHYRRHPEDSRLHYMIGFCALLRRGYAFAEERLTFAWQLLPADLDARALAAVAIGMQGRLDEAQAELETVRDAPAYTAGQEHQPGLDALMHRLTATTTPFIREPRLYANPNAGALDQVIRAVFEARVQAELGG